MKPVPLYYVWQYTDIDRAFWEEHLEGWVPRRMFDVHTHVNDPQFRTQPMTDQKRRQHWVNEVAEPINAADAQRCHGLVFPHREFCCLAFGYPFADYDLAASNASLQDACVRRGWYRLAVIRPQWSAEQVAGELAHPNVVGVKVFHRLAEQGRETSLFDFLPRPHLEVLDAHHAWVTLHLSQAARRRREATIGEIREIRQRYPRIVLVIAHLAGCRTPAEAEAWLPPLADDGGLYVDNSAVLHPEVHTLALKVFGAGRVLFGSENPRMYMRGRPQWAGEACRNHTSYPFFFNTERKPPDVEACYTLYVYEALRALKQGCEALALDRYAVEAVFHANAQRLVESIVSRKGIWRGGP
jgi:hypothetical protein